MIGLMNYLKTAKPLLGRALAPVLLAVSFLATASIAQATARVPLLPQLASSPDPDSQLIAIYKDLGANNLRQAQLRADALVTAYPNFLLGQLVRGDLLMMHTRPVTGLGTSSKGDRDKLEDLREEAMVRLNSLRERPDPDLVPRTLLKLREDQRFALVVDTKRSRLYVYQNLRGQIKLMTDYYITQGKLGSNKIKEGDQKTPVGVYYITGRLGRNRLPDFYGAGALPINYPNEWDRLNGRSGSGIWLHGTPSDSYSRPPLASDGCVVLTNPDLIKLFRTVDPGKTPVIISEQVEFVTRKALTIERDAANGLLDEWRRDLESLSTTRFMNNYSAQFKSALGEDRTTWSDKHVQTMAGIKDMSITLQDVTIFAYPGHKGLIVSTFTQASTQGKRHTSQRKRQYWAKEGRSWKIVYEGIL
ncbi:MAG: murein L,D-transpeptidase YafK [Burkholderiaceae bacterium]|jgi:murein L,D-transpeptidase YafK